MSGSGGFRLEQVLDDLALSREGLAGVASRQARRLAAASAAVEAGSASALASKAAVARAAAAAARRLSESESEEEDEAWGDQEQLIDGARRRGGQKFDGTIALVAGRMEDALRQLKGLRESVRPESGRSASEFWGITI